LTYEPNLVYRFLVLNIEVQLSLSRKPWFAVAFGQMESLAF